MPTTLNLSEVEHHQDHSRVLRFLLLVHHEVLNRISGPLQQTLYTYYILSSLLTNGKMPILTHLPIEKHWQALVDSTITADLKDVALSVDEYNCLLYLCDIFVKASFEVTSR